MQCIYVGGKAQSGLLEFVVLCLQFCGVPPRMETSSELGLLVSEPQPSLLLPLFPLSSLFSYAYDIIVGLYKVVFLHFWIVFDCSTDCEAHAVQYFGTET